MSTAITLFGLVIKRNDTRSIFSSFVWMIKADFAILGVTYKGVNKSFSEIRHLFEEVKNPNVTIPTITIKVGMSTSQALGRLLSGSRKVLFNETPFPSEGEKAHANSLRSGSTNSSS
nr:hypothetical protein I308_06784 [Cryptococcus tetragattii IND107]